MAEPGAAAVLWTEVEHPATDVVVVHCHGRLVAGADGALYTQVRALISGTPRIILDLKELKHTDSLGLGTLVRLYVAARSAGCSLELMHLSQQIRYLLGLTNLLDVFVVLGERGGIRFL